MADAGLAVKGPVGFTFTIEGRPSGRTTGHFRGSLDAQGVLRGTVKLKTPTGLTDTFNFAWRLENGTLSGRLYENSLTNFTATKR